MSQEYSPEIRLGRKFSDNVLFGDEGVPDAETLAVSEGCPVKDMAIGHYGAEAAALRYGEIIFARQLILESAEKHNPELHKQLTADIPRNPEEPVGNHEVGAVPESHLSTITANNTPWGSSTPRLLIEMYGGREERTQQSILATLDSVDEVVANSSSPLELVARLAEKAITSGVDKAVVLKRTISAAYKDEENTVKMYKQLENEVERHAPTVWEEYSEKSGRETLVQPKFVDTVAGKFPEMGNTDRIAAWAKENPHRVGEVVDAYFDLMQDINEMDTNDGALRELVPHAIELKKASDAAEVPLPQLDDFGGFPSLLTVFRGLRDSRGAILAGQDIKRGEKKATPANIKFAVGTTALDLENDDLGPPIIGHLMERAVYRYLSNRGVELPDNPKDSILHPQADMLKLRYARGQESPLVEVYTNPNLGWSSMEKFDTFKKNYLDLIT